MCGGPTDSMPNVQPVFVPSLTYYDLSLGVSSIQASNTQDADIPRQHTLSFTATIYGPSQEADNAICLGSSTGNVI